MAQEVCRRKARPGRPVTVKTDENVERVRILVRTDRRLGIRTIAEEMNMDKKNGETF
jgi:hypothetical protein